MDELQQWSTSTLATSMEDHLHKTPFTPPWPNLHPISRDLNVHDDDEELPPAKEMMYRAAAMRPVEIDPAAVKKPRRRNARISDEPQSVAARLRRERIGERFRILRRLVPGAAKLDTAAMLDEAARYVKFLKRQVHHHQHSPPAPAQIPEVPACFGFGDQGLSNPYQFHA